MTKPLLDISNIEVCYFGKPVVRDLSLKIEPGEILGIVGESGSGKSTVIRAAMGLLKKGGTVTKGEISYKGQSITQAGEEELRKIRGPEMGMVFRTRGLPSALCVPLKNSFMKPFWSMKRSAAERLKKGPWKSLKIWDSPEEKKS